MFLLDPFKEKLFWNLLKSLEMVLFLEHQASSSSSSCFGQISPLICKPYLESPCQIYASDNIVLRGAPKTLPPFVGIFLLLFSSNVESSIFHANWLAWLLQSAKMDKNLEKSSNFRSHIIICLNQRQNQLVTAIHVKWNTQPFLLYHFYFPWITFVFLRGCEWVTTCDRA